MSNLLPIFYGIVLLYSLKMHKKFDRKSLNQSEADFLFFIGNGGGRLNGLVKK